MKTLFKKHIALLLVLTGLAACSEDDLIKDSTGRFDSANYLTTEAEAGPADAPKLQEIGRLVHEMDNPAIKDVWHALYRIVNASNALLNNIGEVEKRLAYF